MKVERQADVAQGPVDEIEELRAELRRVERDYEARLRELANLSHPAPSPEASLGPYHLMLDLERARAQLVERVHDLERQLARSEEERHRVTADRDRVAVERDEAVADREAQAARLPELERRALEAERRSAELERDLTTITSSWSWRLGRRLVTAAKRVVPRG